LKKLIKKLIHETLALAVGWRERPPTAGQPPVLIELFEALRRQPPVDNAWEIEDRIWEIWTDHADPAAARDMNKAIGLMAQKRFEPAEDALDDLIRREPDWAEAWNKRATLHFLRGRDHASLTDIRRTLELEPRHFGAISGCAQICLRHGDVGAASLAIETALQINPHLRLLRMALTRLRDGHPDVRH
jgi:tetratricopeptide (TPR) repeat protein